jgi:choline monooxygenase
MVIAIATATATHHFIDEGQPAAVWLAPSLPASGAFMKTALHNSLAAFDPELPLDRARTIPAAWYHDPALYELERRAVFGDSWQPIARQELLSEPGAYATADVAGEPILLVRGDDGQLRGFFNVCRHRAAPVMNEPCGKASRLRCRYHGWTYDLAGRLRGLPEFDGVEDFRREDHGLPPVSVAVWGPFAWAHFESSPLSLEEYLAPLPQRVGGAELAGLRWVARKEYDVACNWKVYVDNYLDGGYHVNTVHPGLAGVLDYSHYRTEVHGNTSVQTSPLRPADGAFAAVRSGGVAQYWWVFPNFMLNLYPGVMDTNLVLPLGPHRCRVIFDFFFANTQGPAAAKYIDDSIAVANQVQLEDMGICEEVQRGLGSRSYDTGRFSVRREIAGYYFHQLLARRLQAAAGL